MTEITKSQNIDILDAINIYCNEKIEGDAILSECTIKFNKNDKFRGRRMLLHLPKSAGVTISPIEGPLGRVLKGASVKNASAFDIDMID